MRYLRAALALLCTSLTGCAPRLADTVPLRAVHWELTTADSLEELHDLRLEDAEGRAVSAVLRRPSAARRSPRGLPGVVLLAGRETGRQAAAVIPGPIDAVVLAIEYPEMIPERMSPGAMLRRMSGIRRSAYRMPGVLRGAARFLARLPAVDSSRIALVGVSFAVPVVAAAGSDPIFCCVALHYGGADLGLLFRNNLPIENSLVRGAVAAFAGWYFRRLEPARHVGEISPTPLLLINGLHDSMVPAESALRLAELARPPVRQVWLPHAHLMPDDFELMRELADSTISHFPQLRP